MPRLAVDSARGAGRSVPDLVGCRIRAPARRSRLRSAPRRPIDNEVRLGGELRSAAWFASHGTDGSVGGFHLDRAATRLESIDFAEHYPPVRAPRVTIATGAMIAATLCSRAVAAFPAARGQGPRQRHAPVPVDPQGSRCSTSKGCRRSFRRISKSLLSADRERAARRRSAREMPRC